MSFDATVLLSTNTEYNDSETRQGRESRQRTNCIHSGRVLNHIASVMLNIKCPTIALL
jgi:hypothetical protein